MPFASRPGPRSDLLAPRGDHLDRAVFAQLAFAEGLASPRPRQLCRRMACGFADREKADLVSIVPRLEMKSALEHLVMPAVGALVLAQYPPESVASASSPVAFANGQLILVRRKRYEAAGGHRAVVAEILEDVR